MDLCRANGLQLSVLLLLNIFALLFWFVEFVSVSKGTSVHFRDVAKPVKQF